jgi:hypothetical protein
MARIYHGLGHGVHDKQAFADLGPQKEGFSQHEFVLREDTFLVYSEIKHNGFSHTLISNNMPLSDREKAKQLYVFDGLVSIGAQLKAGSKAHNPASDGPRVLPKEGPSRVRTWRFVTCRVGLSLSFLRRIAYVVEVPFEAYSRTVEALKRPAWPFYRIGTVHPSDSGRVDYEAEPEREYPETYVGKATFNIEWTDTKSPFYDSDLLYQLGDCASLTSQIPAALRKEYEG